MVAFCEPEVLLSWRTPRRQRVACLLWTALAFAAAVAMEVTGPPVPESFGMRLPSIVLAVGGTWCAARWRRRVTVTADAVIVRTLWRTRRIPHAAALCSTALGTSLFIARSQRSRMLLPAAMATPWLVVTATLGVAMLTAKLLTEYPQLTGAILAVGAAACLTALGACLPLDRLAAARTPQARR